MEICHIHVCIIQRQTSFSNSINWFQFQSPPLFLSKKDHRWSLRLVSQIPEISLPSSYQDLQRWEKSWQRDIGKLQDLVESQKKLDRTVIGWIRDNTGDCHKCWDNNYNARKVKHYHPWLPREWNSVGSRKINGWHGESLGGCSYTSKK